MTAGQESTPIVQLGMAGTSGLATSAALSTLQGSRPTDQATSPSLTARPSPTVAVAETKKIPAPVGRSGVTMHPPGR